MTILLAAALLLTVFTFFWALILAVPYIRAYTGSALPGFTPVYSAALLFLPVLATVWLWIEVL